MCKVDIVLIPPIVLYGSITPLIHVVNDLGLQIDLMLDWRARIAHVSQKVTLNYSTV